MQQAVVRHTRPGVRPRRQLLQVRGPKHHRGQGAHEAHPRGVCRRGARAARRPRGSTSWTASGLGCWPPQKRLARGGGTACRLLQGRGSRGPAAEAAGRRGRGASEGDHTGDMLVEGVLGDGPRELLLAEALPDAVVLVQRHHDGAVVDGARDVVPPHGLQGVCGSLLSLGYSAPPHPKKARTRYLQVGSSVGRLRTSELGQRRSRRGRRTMTAEAALLQTART